MKLIPRYLISQLSVMTLYALLALLALYSFFDVMNEIGDVGKGSYTSAKMMQYVLLQLPCAFMNCFRWPCSSAACWRSRNWPPAAN